MPISFKSLLSSSVANDTFMDRTVDTDTVGIVALKNDEVASGAHVDNVQGSINDNRADIDQNITDITSIFAELALGTKAFIEYATDAAYELDHGAPTGGEVYYNTTTGLVRYYDAVKAEWTNVGSGGGVASQEALGVGDGVTTDFSLTTVPTSDESVLVTLNGLVIPNSDWSIAGGIITFNTAPYQAQTVYAFYLTEGTPVNPPVTGGSLEVEYITITALMISNKTLTLGSAPSEPTKTLVDLVNGSTQVYGLDFTVSTNNVDWNGLGMDGVLVAGNIIRFTYIA